VAARRRMEPRRAALLVFLTFFVLGTGFAFQYAIWLLPFMLLATRLRWAALLQAGLFAPALIYYAGPFHIDALVAIYFVLMAAVWAGQGAALVATVRERRAASLTA
jgi:hypothetical protein